MFSENHTSGKHMICDIRNIQNMNLLNDSEKLQNLLNKICEKYDYPILGVLNHLFTPEGCTILFLLSESHISIHTFPEKSYLAFDLYTCRNYDDDSDYIRIYHFLLEELQAGVESSYTIINRKF
jgi:S-adenosylmethionine decarboxylase